jgi:hypothetical protein
MMHQSVTDMLQSVQMIRCQLMSDRRSMHPWLSSSSGLVGFIGETSHVKSPSSFGFSMEAVHKQSMRCFTALHALAHRLGRCVSIW